MTTNKAFRDLLLALRNLPQAETFRDVRPKITPEFRNEIDRILESLDTPQEEK